MEMFLFLLLTILVFVFIRKVNELSRKVDYLQTELLRRQQIATPPATAATMPQAPESPAASPVIASEPKPIFPQAPAAPTPPPPKPLSPPPPPKHSRTRAEWEALVGGKLLNRIGAFALILGVGFFLKYAFDNNWLSETMRVLIGAAIGAGLLVLGNRSHRKGLQIFSQGLIGAGLAILYLSVYASFNFYHLVPQTAALVLMAGVTALAFWQAFVYDSIAISVLGWAGGFLTPVMLSTGTANEVGLFTYVALLSAGLLAVTLKKEAWVILEPLTLAGMYLVYFVWFADHYSENDFGLTVFFLTIFWGLFFGLDMLHALRPMATFNAPRQIVAGLNAALYYLGMAALFEDRHEQWTSAMTLALGAVYFLAMWAIKRRTSSEALTTIRLTLTAIILLVIATAIEFSGFKLIILLSLEALALLACGRRWRLSHVWQSGLALIGISVYALLFTNGALAYQPISEFKLVLNQRFLAFAILAATCFAAARFMKTIEHRQSQIVQISLHYAWCVLLFILFTVETNDIFAKLMLNTAGQAQAHLSSILGYTFATVWAFFALPVTLAGMRQKMFPLLYSGLAILSLALIWAVLQTLGQFKPLSDFALLINHRFLLSMVLLAAAFFLMREASRFDKLAASPGNELLLGKDRQRPAWLRWLLIGIPTIIILFVFALFTAETRDYFDRDIFLMRRPDAPAEHSQKIEQLRNLKQLSISGVWLLYSIALMVIGIWRREQGLRLLSIGIFGITILKIFLYDLSFLTTLYRIFAFLGLGLILLLVSYLYQKCKTIIFDASAKPEETG